MKKNKRKEDFEIGQNAYLHIVNAISKMHSLVSATMGPSGGTVIIPSSTEYGKYVITKDGVSVAKHVKSTNRFEQVVIDLMKEVAENTVRIAGDGTTTSIVLTAYLLECLIKAPLTKENFKKYQECLEQTLETLQKESNKLRKEDIFKIANVSCNGDEEIAKKIEEAYKKSKVVHISKSKFDNDTVDFYDGLLIPSQLIKSYNYTVSKNFSDDAIVTVIDQQIKSLKLIQPVIEKSMRDKKTYIVVCNHVDQEVLNFANRNNAEGKTNVIFIKSPGFSSHRTNLLSDIANYCNCKLVTDSDTKINATNIGTIDSFELSKDKVIFKSNTNNVTDLITELEAKLTTEEDEHNQDLINQRLDRLKGIVEIKVGAKSENELNERYDRYEDAVLAVKCAIEEGIVEGAGIALLKIAQTEIQKINESQKDSKGVEDVRVLFYNALIGPFNTIKQNGAELTEESVKDIYDPLKVTKTALVQAFNFVKLLLTNRAIILTNGDTFN